MLLGWTSGDSVMGSRDAESELQRKLSAPPSSCKMACYRTASTSPRPAGRAFGSRCCHPRLTGGAGRDGPITSSCCHPRLPPFLLQFVFVALLLLLVWELFWGCCFSCCSRQQLLHKMMLPLLKVCCLCTDCCCCCCLSQIAVAAAVTAEGAAAVAASAPDGAGPLRA